MRPEPARPDYRAKTITAWPWKPTPLVGQPVDMVRATVLGQIHALRLWVRPVPQGVRL